MQESGFGVGSVGGVDLVDLLEHLASLGFGAADDGGGLLVESHGFLQAAEVVRIELQREVELVAHLAGQRNAAAEDSGLESFVAEGVGVLAVVFAAAGGGLGGAAGEIDGAVEVSEGVIDAGEPEERFGVVGVVLEALLGDAVELAVVSLLEQGFAVGGKGEGGGEENKQQHRTETEGKRHRTS